MSPVNFHEYIGIFEDAQPTEAPISTAPVKSRAQPIGPYIAEAHTQLFPFRFCTEHAPKRQNGVQLSFSQFFWLLLWTNMGWTMILDFPPVLVVLCSALMFFIHCAGVS